MSRTQQGLLVLLGLPGLVLGVAGLTHPAHLTPDTARWWATLHILGIGVFPLVGVALMALVGLRSDLAAWSIRITAFVYATAYSALDIISGVTAGYVTHRLGHVPRPDAVRYIFAIGTPIGHVGSLALILCGLIVTAQWVARYRVRGAAAGLIPLGALLLHEFHIYPPYGAGGIALVGLGTAWAAYVVMSADSIGADSRGLEQTLD